MVSGSAAPGAPGRVRRNHLAQRQEATSRWQPKGGPALISWVRDWSGTVNIPIIPLSRNCNAGSLASLLHRLLQPGDHFRFPVLLLRGLPTAHAVAAAFDGDQLAARSHLFHGAAHRGGLLVRHLIVLVPVNAQERRHSLVDRENRRDPG